MQPKEQYELYKLFCDLMNQYTKTKSLSEASNILNRRYRSCVASIRRYLVQTFAHLGIHDVYASKAIDDSKGKFVGIPDPSYWFINPERYPELGKQIKEMEKLFNASKNCNIDYIKSLRKSSSYFGNIDLQLKQYNYIPSPLIKKKIYIVNSINDLLDGKGEFNKKGNIKSIASNYIYGDNGKRIDTDHYVKIEEDPSVRKAREARWGMKIVDDPSDYADDGSPYIPVTQEIAERKKYILDIVIDILQFFYKQFKKSNDEFTFYQIFETTQLDTRFREGNTIENSLQEAYKLFELPENPIPHIRLEYTTLESITPKTKPVSQPSKVKQKEEVNKNPTTKKTVEIKPVKKEEVKVVETKKINDEPINVLDISTHTKLYNGFRIDKVENKAKKIIIDDRVVELNSRAFLECYKLEEITIGKNVETIQYGQFANLLNLCKVTFNEGLLYIESSAFENTNLQGSITLPNTVMLVGNKAFDVINPNILEIHLSSDTMYNKTSFHNLIKLYIDGKLKEKEVKQEEIKKETNITSSYKKPSNSLYIEYVDEPFDLETVESDDYCDDEFAFVSTIDDDKHVVYSLSEGHEIMLIPSPYQVIDFDINHLCHVDDEVYKIKKFILSDSVEEIKPKTFDAFMYLKELILPNNISMLPERLLTISNWDVEHLEIPNSVIFIHPDCFIDSHIRYLTIGENVDISKVNFPRTVKVYIKK